MEIRDVLSLRLKRNEYVRWEEFPTLEAGTRLRPSRQYRDNMLTGFVMKGTSAISPRALAHWILVNTPYTVQQNMRGYYFGYPYVVTGTPIYRGVDPGEVILVDATIVRPLFKRNES